MTRTERMMQHLRLLQANRVVSVQRLCDLSGVSSRTIYRDILLLSRMNFPIYYDDGYRLAQSHQLPIPELDTHELELLSFCLNHNPLASFPSFARQFRQLEKRILQRMQHRTTGDSARSLPIASPTPRSVSLHEDRMMRRFLRGLERSSALRVVLKDEPHTHLSCLPRGLAFRQNSVLLSVELLPARSRLELPLNQIQEIRVTSATGLTSRSRLSASPAKKALTHTPE